MQKIEEDKTRAENAREWETTTGTNFGPTEPGKNAVGRRVMKTRDGDCIPISQRDEQFLVETKLGERKPKSDPKELMEKIPKVPYTAAQPITFYTHHMERKNYYMSAGTGPNPFARSCGMTQPVQNTKAARNYECNVDFGKEQTSVNNFLKSGDVYAPGQ